MDEVQHLPPLDLEPNSDPTERSGVREPIAPRNATGDNVTIQKNWQELIRPNKLQVSAGAFDLLKSRGGRSVSRWFLELY